MADRTRGQAGGRRAAPRAQRPLEIAVTGHRFLADVDKLDRAVRRALELLAARYPERELRICSALAEGADRLVARRVLAANEKALTAVLPMEQQRYEATFEGKGAVEEFRGLLASATERVLLSGAENDEQAYAAANDYLLGRCDALIALWDGKNAPREGSTAKMVEKALGQGLPVVHILTGNRRPGTGEPTSLGGDQGRLVCHHLPPQ